MTRIPTAGPEQLGAELQGQVHFPDPRLSPMGTSPSAGFEKNINVTQGGLNTFRTAGGDTTPLLLGTIP